MANKEDKKEESKQKFAADRREELEERQIAYINIVEDLEKKRRELEESQIASLNIMEDLDRAYKGLQASAEREKELAAAAAAAETDRKRAAELEKAYQELRKTQAGLIQMGKLSAVGQLSAGMAHEINNPLAIISSNAQCLLDMFGGKKRGKISEAEFAEYLDGLKKIVEESMRCGEITSGLLQFAIPEAPKMEFTNINGVIENILSITTHTLSLKKIRIDKRLAPDLPGVKANTNQLKQVFMNMILNAQAAMPDGGHLTVKTLYNLKDKHVEIKFADTGLGIPEEIRGRIFDPFFSTRPIGKGVGLGLSVSYGIISAHNGTIDVESQAGKGTTFTIKLPVKPKEENNEGK